MNAENSQKKQSSPRSSTEICSIQKNKSKNREALEKSLSRRRPIKDLVNQGILLYPSTTYPVKARELQLAKTADLLKRKIAGRPDKQALINRRILKDNMMGTSPLIQEKCNALTKNHLCETLNLKLEKRPGSLELVEKGVLQVDPGVATLIRGGSIVYPRVDSSRLLCALEEHPEKAPSSAFVFPQQKKTTPVRVKTGNSSKAPSRSLRDETVISRYGSLTFHSYRPASPAKPPPVSAFSSGDSVLAGEEVLRQHARELQQAELLHLEDRAQAHRMLGEEICQLKGVRPAVVRQSVARQNPVLLPINTDSALHQTANITNPSQINSNGSFCLMLTSVPMPPPPPAPPIFSFCQNNYSNPVYMPQNPLQIIEDSLYSATVTSAVSLPQALSVVSLTDGGGLNSNNTNGFFIRSTSPNIPISGSPLHLVASQQQQSDISSGQKKTIPALRQFEMVWLRIRQLQLAISEEMSILGFNLDPADGFPAAFSVALSTQIKPAKAASLSLKLAKMQEDHAELSALARLLIVDRLAFLDAQANSLPDGAPTSGSDLERGCLKSYMQRLGGNFQTHRRIRNSSLGTSQSPFIFRSSLSPSAQVRPSGISYLNNRYSTILPAADTFPEVFQLISGEDGTFHHHQQQQQQTSFNSPLAVDSSICSFSTGNWQWLPAEAGAGSGTLRHVTNSIPANLHLQCGGMQPPVWQQITSPTTNNHSVVFLPPSPASSGSVTNTQLQTDTSFRSLSSFDNSPFQNFSAADEDLNLRQQSNSCNTEDLLSYLPLEEQSAMCADLLASFQQPSISSDFCSNQPSFLFHQNTVLEVRNNDGDEDNLDNLFIAPMECIRMDTSSA